MVKAIRIGNFWSGEINPITPSAINEDGSYSFVREVGADTVLKKLGNLTYVESIYDIHGIDGTSANCSTKITANKDDILFIYGAISGNGAGYTMSLSADNCDIIVNSNYDQHPNYNGCNAICSIVVRANSNGEINIIGSGSNIASGASCCISVNVIRFKI